jgi:hypothetical protein
MNDVSIVAADGGEVIELGPDRIRILEDGRRVQLRTSGRARLIARTREDRRRPRS